MYVEAARLFNFTYVKLHPLDISDIEILELEKDDNNNMARHLIIMRMLGTTCGLFGMTTG